MQIRIVCPETSAYEGECAFVALPGTDGELGVASGHANEICTLSQGVVRVSDQRMGTVDRRFVVSGGYAEVTADEVVLLADRACDADAVDREKMAARKADFEDKLSNLSEDDARRAYLYNEIAWCELVLAS